MSAVYFEYEPTIAVCYLWVLSLATGKGMLRAVTVLVAATVQQLCSNCAAAHARPALRT
jgi:hypothetical protein